MTGLRPPVKRALRKTLTAASVERMWHRIEARERACLPRPASRWPLAVVASIALVAILALWSTSRKGGTASSSRALARADGSALSSVHAGHEQEVLVLNDGTRFVLKSGTSLIPLRNLPEAVAFEQSIGHVDYDVTPGTGRRWTIECGAATVEVIGTSFEIDRSEARVSVRVSRGTVLVRDNTVPDRTLRLSAGMTTDVPSLAAPVPVSTAADDLPPRPGAEEVSRAAAAGKNDKASGESVVDGRAAKSKSDPIDELFALADAARSSGHPAEAVEPLQRIVARYPTDVRASLAALTLGRIQLRSLGEPNAAARSLEKAIALGIPSEVGEDAYALLIESLSKVGERERARATYEQFSTRFPKSERLSGLAVWIRSP